MSRTFFFQQNDTKINDFDEGVLILEPFFWDNVIFKICSFCIKSHVWGREEFTKQDEQTLYTGKPNNEKCRYVNCDFWDRKANLENDIASEKRSKRLHQN